MRKDILQLIKTQREFIRSGNSFWIKTKDGADGELYKYNGLIVIWSIAIEQDGYPWLHVSFSRKSRIPDYNDTKMVKRDFIGENKKAIMVLPEKEKHINLHEYCLHLFCCLEYDPLPDFTQGGISI